MTKKGAPFALIQFHVKGCIIDKQYCFDYPLFFCEFCTKFIKKLELVQAGQKKFMVIIGKINLSNLSL